MATTTIKVNVESNLEKEARLAKAVKDELQAAGKVRLPSAVHAAREGVTASNNQARGPSGTNLARGIAGQTGAEGRDFAKQAQGLGGLVHVYATFAANIFAVSAAFGALSRAADTTNMVKGLDQLGVSSGKALGSLAKQLAATTDGAISLRDAMTSVAQASSGGMSSDAILRMGAVAKQASQALGIAMPDAISRLTRGIIKLEPELLDEIGIMVRLDKATQDYARELGKTTSSLTEFERRQGFANAVLEQGEKKFGNIKIDANPYAKILASMENLAQKGLELVNKVLSPILNILASSPTALATAMGLVGIALLKQALPALGMFRESLQQAADAARDLAIKKAADAKASIATEFAMVKAAEIAKGKEGIRQKLAQSAAKAKIDKAAADEAEQFAVDRVDAADARLRAIRDKGLGGKTTLGILDKAAYGIDEDDVKRLELNASQAESKVAKGNKGLVESAKLQREAASALREQYEAGKARNAIELANEKALKDARLAARNELKALSEANKGTASQAASDHIRNMSIVETAKQTELIANRAILASVKQNIVANAAYTGSTRGLKDAWTEAGSAIAKARVEGNNISAMAGGVLQLKAGIAGATGAIGTLMAALGPWMAAIGLIVAGFAALDAWQSTATKEISQFDASLESLTANTKLLKEVSADLYSKGSAEWLTAESMTARATAMVGLSDSISATVTNLKKATLASSSWDDMWDGFLWTDSRSQKASKDIGKGILEAINIAPDSEAKVAYEKYLESILGPKYKKRLTSLDVDQDTQAQLAKNTKKFTDSQANVAEVANAGTKAISELDKAYSNLKISLTPSDNLYKYGEALLNTADAMRGLAKDTESAFQELVRLSNNPGDAAKLGKFGTAIVAQAEQLNAVNLAYNTQIKAVKALQDQQEKLVSASKDTPVDTTGMSLSQALTARQQASERIKASNATTTVNVQEEISKGKKILSELQSVKTQYATQLAVIEKDLLKAGLDAVAATFTNIVRAAQLKLEGTVASLLTGEAGIKAREAVALKEVDLRIAANKITAEQIRVTEQNTIQLEILALSLAVNTARLQKADATNSGADKETIIGINSNIKRLEDSIGTLNKASGMLDGNNTFKKYRSAREGSDDDKKAADRVKGVAGVLASSEASAAAAGYEKAGIRLTAAAQLIVQNTTTEVSKLNTVISDLDSTLKTLDTLSGASSSVYFEELAIATSLTKATEQRKVIEEEIGGIKKLEAELLKNNTKGAEGRALIEKNTKDSLELQAKKLTELNKSVALNTTDLQLKKAAKSEALELLEITKKQVRFDQDIAFKQTSLDTDKSALEVSKLLVGISESEYISRKSILDLKAVELDKTKEIDAAGRVAQATNREALATLEKGRKVIEDSAAFKTPEEKAKALLGLQQQYLSSVYQTSAAETLATANATAKATAASKTLVVQAELSTLTANQVVQMDKMKSVAETLATLFGEMGENIGAAGQAMLELAQSEETYQKNKALLLKNDPKADTAELDKKRNKEKLDGENKLLKSARKLFDEKTYAAKVLSNIEKVNAAKSVAIDFKALTDKLGFLKAEGDAENSFSMESLAKRTKDVISKIMVDIPGIYTAAMKEFGPIAGPIIATAQIASFVGPAFSKGGGGDTGVSAESLREVQGTGQSYNSAGKIVENGLGVYGDPTALNNGIQNSLDILTDMAKPELAYISKMVMLLGNIDNSLSGAAALSYTDSINVATESAAAASKGVDGGKLGAVVDKLLSFIGLGGSGGSKFNVTGVGVSVPAQKLNDAIAQLSATNYILADKIHDDGGVIRGIRNPDEMGAPTSASPEFKQAIQAVLSDTKTSALELAKQFGSIPEITMSKLDELTISIGDIDFLGADTLEKRKEILGAAMGKVYDQIILATLPDISGFRKSGDTLTVTAMRIASGMEDATYHTDKLGIQSIKYTDIIKKQGDVSAEMVRQSVTNVETLTSGVGEIITTFSGSAEEISSLYSGLVSVRSTLEALGFTSEVVNSKLLKGAGGLDSLTEGVDAFTSGFLLETDQLTLKTNALKASFAKINVEMPTSAEGFKQLVAGLRTGGEASAETLGKVIVLSGGMKELTDLTDKASAAIKDQALELLSLKGLSDQVLQAQRADKLKELGLKSKELVLGQEAIYKQQDKNKTDGLSLELLNAQGKSQEALNITRANELKGLSDTDKLIKQATFDAQDKNKTDALNIELLNAQEKAQEALALTRQKELAALDKSQQAIKLRTYLLIDEANVKAKAKEAENARVSVATAYKEFQTTAIATSDALRSASETITKGYLAAKDTADKAAASVADLTQKENDRIAQVTVETGKKLKGFTKELRKFIEELVSQSLPASAMLDYLQREFDKTAALAKTGDEEALQDLSESASSLLEQAKESSSTYVDFARINGRTIASLTEVADAVDAKADPMLGALGLLTDEQIATRDYTKNLVELQREAALANADLEKWTIAIKESGASTEDTFTDYLKDWRKAKAEDDKAQFELIEATKIIRDTNVVIPTKLDSLALAMQSMADAITTLSSTMGAFANSVITSVQSKTITADAAIKALESSGTTLAKDTVTNISTGGGNTTPVWRSETTGGSALAIANSTGSDYTVYSGTDFAYTGTEIRDWVSAPGRKPEDVYAGAISKGISGTTLDTIMGWEPGFSNNWADLSKLPRFASGGDHIGGMRLVGEQGPELEVTGPSKIYNNGQTRGLLNNLGDNSEIVAELRKLQREVANLIQTASTNNTYNKKTADLLFKVTQGGDSMLVESLSSSDVVLLGV